MRTRAQGYGYVVYEMTADATKALEHWNGREVAGIALKVSIQSLPPVAPLGGGMPVSVPLGGLPGMGLPPPPAAPQMPALPSASLLAAAPQLSALLPQLNLSLGGALGLPPGGFPGLPAGFPGLPGAPPVQLPGPPPLPGGVFPMPQPQEQSVPNSGIGEQRPSSPPWCPWWQPAP